jgi:plastocyanin
MSAGATALACGALVLGGAGVGSAAAAPNVIKNVSMANYAFTPRTSKIKLNSKVVWTNNDTTGHNVLFTDFGTKRTVAPGNTYAHKFTTAGTFAYHCSLHPGMTGKVVVSG